MARKKQKSCDRCQGKGIKVVGSDGLLYTEACGICGSQHPDIETIQYWT